MRRPELLPILSSSHIYGFPSTLELDMDFIDVSPPRHGSHRKIFHLRCISPSLLINAFCEQFSLIESKDIFKSLLTLRNTRIFRLSIPSIFHYKHVFSWKMGLFCNVLHTRERSLDDVFLPPLVIPHAMRFIKIPLFLSIFLRI